MAVLARTYPKLAAVLPHARISRNGRYVTVATTRLRAGDEIAVHPPYSGG